jgi:hypothetical protein
MSAGVEKQTASFEELQAYGLGYLKSAAQAECYRVFDKMVERASREMNEGYGPSDLTRIRAIR